MSLTLPTAMEIRFCDLCHESIPDADFETGRAVAIDGRTMCVACGLKRSLSLSGPRAWLTLLLALYAAGTTTWLLARKPAPAGVSRPVETAIRDQGEATFARAAKSLDAAAAALQAEVTLLRTQTQDGLGALATRLDQASEKTAQERIETLTLVGVLRTRVEAAEKQVGEVHEWLRELKARAERELAQPAAGEPVPAPGPDAKPEPLATAPTPTPPPEPAAPPPAADLGELQHSLDMLEHPNAGVAFSATIALGRLKDLRAVPALLKALKSHKDFYVRLGAADALRELKACDAVPDLVDALDDKDDLVRSAANMALQGITQHEESFAPTLGRQELRRVQAAWKRWWKENEVAVRQRLGQPAKAP